jgi:hypothetical protein
MVPWAEAALEDESSKTHGSRPVRHLPALHGWRRGLHIRPPGATMTAVPETLGRQGRSSVGLSSPCPNAPGAKFSHNRIVCVSALGSWCAWPSAIDAEKRQRTKIVGWCFHVAFGNRIGRGPTHDSRTWIMRPTPHQNVPDHRKISVSRYQWLRVRHIGWRGAPLPAREDLLQGRRQSCR